MSEADIFKELFTRIMSEAGLIGILLFLFNIALILLFRAERKERVSLQRKLISTQETHAQKYAEHIQNTNKVLESFIVLLELVKTGVYNNARIK